MLRERAISSVALVAVLAIVLLLGEPWIAAAVVIVTVLAAIEVFALLRAAGWTVLPLLGVAFAVIVVVDAAAPAELRGSSVLLGAIGLSLIAVGAFTLPDPRQGLTAWGATAFGGSYAAQLGFIIRLGTSVPPLPTTAPLQSLGA